MQSSSQSDGISRGIVKFNHPALKTVCPAFDWNRPDHLQGLADLKATLLEFPRARALAANQIGFIARVFVMRLVDGIQVCANPQVEKASGITGGDDEECMSFPGMLVCVHRPLSGTVSFESGADQSKPGARTLLPMSGINFRCFLHELDHLNGITIDLIRRKQRA